MGEPFALWNAIVAGWNWIGANAGTLIALAGLIYAARQFAVARKHNHIAVKPIVLWQFEQGHVAGSEGSVGLLGYYGLKLTNMGTGIACVTAYRVRLDDVEVPSQMQPLCAQVSSYLGSLGAQVSTFRAWDTLAPFWISTGSIDVLFVSFTVPNAASHEAVVKYLRRFSVSAEYESIYGEISRMDSRDPHVV